VVESNGGTAVNVAVTAGTNLTHVRVYEQVEVATVLAGERGNRVNIGATGATVATRAVEGPCSKPHLAAGQVAEDKICSSLLQLGVTVTVYGRTGAGLHAGGMVVVAKRRDAAGSGNSGKADINLAIDVLGRVADGCVI